MALFVMNALRTKGNFPEALSAAVSVICSIMKEFMGEFGAAAGQELRLVFQQDKFSNPSHFFKAAKLNLHR